MSQLNFRKEMEFQKAVERYFSFVEKKYNFKTVFSDLYCVKYFSSRIFLNVYHEKHSYEVYFSIGTIPESSNNSKKVSMHDILFSFGKSDEQMLFQASSKESLDFCVKTIASYAEKYATEALEGNLKFFNEVIEYIENERINENKRIQTLEKRTIAEQAWKENKYEILIDIYNKLNKNDLTPIDNARIAYALKKINH